MLRRAMLVEHNAARAAVDAAPLTWSDELAADAARYAAVLAETRDFKHSTGVRGRIPEGENLFMGSMFHLVKSLNEIRRRGVGVLRVERAARSPGRAGRSTPRNDSLPRRSARG